MKIDLLLHPVEPIIQHPPNEAGVEWKSFFGGGALPPNFHHPPIKRGGDFNNIQKIKFKKELNKHPPAKWGGRK